MVVSDGLAKLQDTESSVSLLSVVGPYHSGKSFFLNSLLGDTRAFAVGARTTPETMGIWLCRTQLKGADGSEVWLMDSEGFFGPGVGESYDAKVFTVASLLGSHLVYNTVKIIDQQAVNLLEILVTQAQLFGSRTTVQARNNAPEFLLTESFPPLTWVVQDFVQELPTQFKQEGPIGYLSTYLEASSGENGIPSVRGNETRETILTKTFREVRVGHLFLPATSKEQLQDLSRLKWDQLTEEYRSEIGLLQGHLMRNVKARRFGGRTATGPALAQALHFTIQALQQGMFHELPSLWTSWTAQVAEMSLRDADEYFAVLLQELDRGEIPTPLATFNAQVEQAREKAIGFYRHLIRDFNVRPQMSDLRQRMDRHFDRKLQSYQERARRWVSELLAQAKESFATYIASLTLPMDPTLLESLGKSRCEALGRNLTSHLDKVSAAGARVTLGPAASMPIFAQAPASQLANDLRAQLGARSLENDREVGLIFKAAAAAADEAVESDLKGIGEALLGKARLTEVTKAAERAGWRAFDERLGIYTWAPKVAKYSVHKAQVQKEAIEARIARFTAANEKRLSAHLHTGLLAAHAAYKERGVAVSMPAPQADLEAQVTQLASTAKDQLAEFAAGLTDTDTYKETSKKFASLLADGRQQLQEKNVELWKVYSDGATRCAAAANAQRWQSCGFFCPFNNVPWAHKMTSRKHLTSCFAKDAVGSRMSPQLQAQVFEVWYSKDVGPAARGVLNRFYAIIITFAILIATIWWFRHGRRYMYCYMPSWCYPVGGNYCAPQYTRQGTWQMGGYGIPRQDPCFVQQPVYPQQVVGGTQHFGPSVTHRRGFFGA